MSLPTSQPSSLYGFDSNNKFDGTKKYFFAYLDDLMTTLRKNQVFWVLSTDCPPPAKPQAALLDFPRLGRLPDDREYTAIEKFHADTRKYEQSAEKCLALITESINATVKATFTNVLRSDISSQLKCIQLIRAMKAHYGTSDEATKLSLMNDMDDLPDAVDTASTRVLLAGMIHINEALRNYESHFSSSALKTKLFKKLKGSRFNEVTAEINRDKDLTFLDACDLVNSALELQNIRDPEVESSRKRSLDDMQTSTNMAMSSSLSASVNNDQYFAAVFRPSSTKSNRSNQWASNPSVSAMQAPSIPPLFVAATATGPSHDPPLGTASRKCWNCKNNGHTAYNCVALFCNNCKQFFSSVDAPNYHTMPNCPQQPPRNNPAFRNGGRGGGGGRDRGNPGRGGNNRNPSNGGRPPTYQRSIAAMTSEDVSIDAEWDNYEAENCQVDHHYDGEYDDFEAEIRACDASSSSLSLMDARRCLMDSGANVNACSPMIVQHFNLPLHKYPTPVRVKFGNGTVVTSTHYTYIGILGRTAVVQGCVNIIISTPTMNQRGYDVLFSANRRCVVSRNGEILSDTPLDQDKSLYFLDVEYLLNTSDELCHARLNSVQKHTHRISQNTILAVHKLHNALRHAASPAVMARALRFGAWIGIDLLPTAVEQVFNHQQCLSCMLGKANHLARSDGTGIRSAVMGECASVDFKPVTPPSISGQIGMYYFTDSATSYHYAVIVHQHDSAHLCQAIQEYKNHLSRYKHTLKKLRFDAGTVENSKDVEAELSKLNILSVPAAPECQFQNPDERHIQSNLKGVAAMFAAQQLLPRYYWNMAELSYLQAVNVCPNSQSGQYSPEFYLTGHHPNISSRFKFYFGEPVVSVILKAQQDKFTFKPRGELGIAIASGPGEHSTATLILIPSRSRHHLYLRHDVRSITPLESTANRSKTELEKILPRLEPDGTISIPAFKVAHVSDFDLSVHPALIPLRNIPREEEENCSILISDMSSSDPATWSFSPGADPPPSMTPRDSTAEPELSDNTSQSSSSTSKPEPLPPSQLEPEWEPISSRLRNRDLLINSSYTSYSSYPSDADDIWQDLYTWPSETDELCINAIKKTKTEDQADIDGEDVSLRYAQQSPEWETLWEPAAKVEFATLAENHTGQEIRYEDIPPNEPILPSKMLFKKKIAADNTFDKAKARLVACGNWMTALFVSLFAPTVNEKSMKLMFALAIIFGLTVTGIDIKGAFLYPDLKKPVYISLPRNLTGGSGFPYVYWKLDKTLYGLPESPQAFYEDVSRLLLLNGYTRSNADPCVFYMRKHGQFIMFTVHVDDFACASSSTYMTNRLLQVLRTRYTITTDVSLEAYLGINIHYNTDGSMTLTQPRRIAELIAHYGPEYHHLQAPTVPMASTFSDDYQNDAIRYDTTAYLSLLGKLIHIIKTRPDIAYSVNRLATRSQHCTTRDYTALLRIVAYLEATSHLGIRMQPGTWDAQAAPKLFGYLDAAYACHADSKSHTGYSFCFNDPLSAMFFSRTMKQTNVTLSSTEAENAAAVEATKEALWFRQLLSDLGFAQLEPTVMFSDSASMITLAAAFSGNHKKTKHYITRINFMIEQVQKGHIQLKHVSGTENVSDMLTKPLGPQDFIRLRAHLLGMQ